MARPLRVLILEDRAADVELMLDALRQADFDPAWKRVDTAADYVAALNPEYDVILSDYRMPQFLAPMALHLLQARQLDIPFIIVTGSISEEVAVECMKQGGADYLLKDRLTRLGPAVAHALEQKRLRDEKRRMVQALQESEQALREAARRKDELLAMLAHELRNPLAPLLTGIEVARRAGSDGEMREGALETIARSVRHLARLVDDLLEATRVAHGGVSFRPQRLDLSRLTRVTSEDRRRALEQAALELTVEAPETPVWVKGDSTRLRQVLHNLLDNAAKFTDRGGRVNVRVSTDPAQGHAVVAVRDTGVGIEAEMLPRLFEVFAQADRSLHRSRGGLGLGLAIVKGLVKLHGGDVQAASAGPGCGAEFCVRLPLEAEPAALTAVAALPGCARQRLRILVIEDNRDAADSLRLLLETVLGHEARVAYTGLEGVDLAVAWQPDVVLTDIGLPGLDGYGVAARLRRNPATAAVRLIAISGYDSEEDRLRSQQAGFDAHLVKPVEHQELQNALAGRAAEAATE
jgi:signal transduction histidine kinase